MHRRMSRLRQPTEATKVVRRGFSILLVVVPAFAALLATGASRERSCPANGNGLSSSFKAMAKWANLQEERAWGVTDGVYGAIDVNIWVFDRCGGESCENSALVPVFEFDPNDTLLKNFGATFFVFPHGIYVDQDKDGRSSVWGLTGLPITRSWASFWP